VEDVTERIKSEIANLKLQKRIKSGDSIAVTAGSRGITDINVITRTVIDELIKLQGKPFIIPAMGSHGGATVSGQLKVLEGYGITECSPIISLNRVNLPSVGVGQLVPDIEMCTIDPESHELLEVGKEGEICVKGPNVFSGYLGQQKDPFITINNDKMPMQTFPIIFNQNLQPGPFHVPFFYINSNQNNAH